MPERSPSSQCGFGSKSKARGVPHARTSTFASSSAPSGTESSSRLGSCSSNARSGDLVALRQALARVLFACVAICCARALELRSRARARPRLCRPPCRFEPRCRFFSAFARSARERGAVLFVVAQNAVDERRIEPAPRQSRRTRSGSRRTRAMSSMEKRAIMQSANPLLPNVGFAPEALLAPRQAIVAYFARVAVAPPGVEHVALDDAFGRVLAQPVAADDDYPERGAFGDGRLRASSRERRRATFEIVGDVAMGTAPQRAIGDARRCASRPAACFPPAPMRSCRSKRRGTSADGFVVDERVASGENVVPRGADMRRGETLLARRPPPRAAEIGLLATLGITQVPVYRRPRSRCFPAATNWSTCGAAAARGQIRDSNRYAIAASLRAMGAAAAPLSDAARRSRRVRSPRWRAGDRRVRRRRGDAAARRSASATACRTPWRARRARHRRARPARQARKADALRRGRR